MSPVRAIRVKLAERRLRALNVTWQRHVAECGRCKLAAMGNRVQRRSVKGRFCAEGGTQLLRVEAALDALRALYPQKKVLQPAAEPGQAAP